MKLFEILTGREGGKSYERCYAWAYSPEAALRAAKARNPGVNFERASVWWLSPMDSDNMPLPEFATFLIDSGWAGESKG